MADEVEYFETCNIRLPSPAPAEDSRNATLSSGDEIGMGLLDRLHQWDMASSTSSNHHHHLSKAPLPPLAQRMASDHSMQTSSTSSSTRSGASSAVAARWGKAATAASVHRREPLSTPGRLRLREALSPPATPKPSPPSQHCHNDDLESVGSEAWTAITDRLDHWKRATHHHCGHSVGSETKRNPGKLRFPPEPKYAYQRRAAAQHQNTAAPFPSLIITTTAAAPSTREHRPSSTIGAGLSERLDQWGRAATKKADFPLAPRRIPGRLMIREAPRETIPEDPVEEFGAGLSERLTAWHKATTNHETKKKPKTIRRNGKKSPESPKKEPCIHSLSFPGMVTLAEEDSDEDDDAHKAISRDEIGAGLSERLGAWGKAATESRQIRVAANRMTPGRLRIHEAPPPAENDRDSWEGLEQKLDQWNKAAATGEYSSSLAATKRTPGRLMIHEPPKPPRH